LSVAEWKAKREAGNGIKITVPERIKELPIKELRKEVKENYATLKKAKVI